MFAAFSSFWLFHWLLLIGGLQTSRFGVRVISELFKPNFQTMKTLHVGINGSIRIVSHIWQRLSLGLVDLLQKCQNFCFLAFTTLILFLATSQKPQISRRCDFVRLDCRSDLAKSSCSCKTLLGVNPNKLNSKGPLQIEVKEIFAQKNETNN